MFEITSLANFVGFLFLRFKKKFFANDCLNQFSLKSIELSLQTQMHMGPFLQSRFHVAIWKNCKFLFHLVHIKVSLS